MRKWLIRDLAKNLSHEELFELLDFILPELSEDELKELRERVA
jgi:hypothetical protein